MDAVPYQVAFNHYLATGKVTAAQMARHAGVGASHIRAVARGDKHLSPDAFHQLSCWLVDEMGLTEHCEAFLGKRGTVKLRDKEGSDPERGELAEVKDAIEKLHDAVESLDDE